MPLQVYKLNLLDHFLFCHIYILVVVTAPRGWRDTHSQAHKLLFLSTQLGCDLTEQKLIQFRKEERKKRDTEQT